VRSLSNARARKVRWVFTTPKCSGLAHQFQQSFKPLLGNDALPAPRAFQGNLADAFNVSVFIGRQAWSATGIALHVLFGPLEALALNFTVSISPPRSIATR